VDKDVDSVNLNILKNNNKMILFEIIFKNKKKFDFFTHSLE
jgi:hypothetical protein